MTPTDIQQLITLAQAGDTDVMFNLGDAYRKGEGVEQDLKMAAEWYRKAADAGNANAMFNLGVAYDNGKGVDQDFKTAVEWYRKAAEADHVSAMFNLGVAYAKGEGVAQDFKTAIEWYRKSAEAGNAHAMFNLGIAYAKGEGVAQDFKTAIEWYRKATDAGHASAMFNLGILYDNGEGVGQDFKTAMEWYHKAAETGHANAMFNLGIAYAKGEGVAQDFKTAIEWYQKAADAGNASAMFNLGFAYNYGKGVEQNFKTAAEWYRKAADTGHASAMFNLGFAYNYGEGVEQDFKTAVVWYRKAAGAGHARAMFNVGFAYYYGQGCQKNQTLAHRWFNKATMTNDTNVLNSIYTSKITSIDNKNNALSKLLELRYPVYNSFIEQLSQLKLAKKLATPFRNFMSEIFNIENDHLTNIKQSEGLTHYTSQAVLSSLIGSRNQPDKPFDLVTNLRLYMASYLNDPTEGHYILDDAFEEIKDLDHVRNLFDLFEQDTDLKIPELPHQIYSLSLSNNPDNLNLWRAYGLSGGKANGVGIFIPKKTLAKYSNTFSQGFEYKAAAVDKTDLTISRSVVPLILYNVEYGAEKVRGMWEQVLPKLTALIGLIEKNVPDHESAKRLKHCIYNALSRISYLYKHDAYAAEQEVRVLHMGELTHTLEDERTPPRLYLKTPPLLFQDTGAKIVLGPQMSSEERSVLLWATRKRLLDLKLAEKVTVGSSTVPYR